MTNYISKKKIIEMFLFLISASIIFAKESLEKETIKEDFSVVLCLLVIILPLIVLIVTMKFAYPNRIITIGLNVLRLVLAITYLRNGYTFSERTFLLPFITSVLTLYGFGSSAFDDTRRESNSYILNPLETGGYALTKGMTGDSPLGNFIFALITSGVVGVIMLILMYLCTRWGEGVPWFFVIVLAIIGIIRGLISFIALIRNR